MPLKATSAKLNKETLKRISQMAETVGRPRAWLMAEAIKQYVTHKEWFTNEVREGLKAADEGRLINDEDIKAKWETRRVAQAGRSSGSHLVNIEARITQENSSLVASRFDYEFIDSVYMILSEHPRARRQGRLKYTRELVINGVSFITMFRESMSANTIEILRALHETQKWPTAY